MESGEVKVVRLTRLPEAYQSTLGCRQQCSTDPSVLLSIPIIILNIIISILMDHNPLMWNIH